MGPIYFDGVESLLRTAQSTWPTFALIVVFTRVFGKRSTSKMNNFDWIVTVAVGSICASTVLLKDVVVLDALVAIGLLMTAQYGVTWMSVRWGGAESLFKSDPTVVVYQGQYCEAAMRRVRVTKREIRAAMRESGLHRLERVAAIVFESDANLSVIPASVTGGEDFELLSEVDGGGSDRQPH